MSESAIQPLEQRTVPFYGDEITAVRIEGDAIYVPVRPICEVLGIAWQPQARKLNADPVLSARKASVTIRLQVDDARGEITTKMVALPLDMLNGWLFRINANRVKDEATRAKVIQYQAEVYQVLWEAFGKNKVVARPNHDLETSQSPSAVAYRNAMAIANIAKAQWEMEQKIEANAERIALLEANFGDESRYVSNSQAMRVSQAVKALALELGKRSGRNEFGGVYGELYRRFEVPDYKKLPAARFDEVMQFMTSWYQSLTDGADVPF